MKYTTEKAFELHLNELYADTYSFYQAIDQFAYLTAKGRRPRATQRTVDNAIESKTLGRLLRKYDSIAFYTLFNEQR
jgi:hypothetical protein